MRSGEITPTSHQASGGSRPGSAMSTSTTASGVVYRRSTPIARKPRPASIAVTGVTPNKDGMLFFVFIEISLVYPLVSNKLFKALLNFCNQSLLLKLFIILLESTDNKRPPLPKSAISSRRPTSASNTPTTKTEPKKIEKPRSSRATPGMTPKGTTPIVSPSPDMASKTMEQTIKQASKTVTETVTKETGETIVTKTEEVTQEVTMACTDGTEVVALDDQKVLQETAAAVVDAVVNAAVSAPNVVEQKQLEPESTQERSNSDLDNVDMTASMIAKKVTTEEEAKAKLAEKRRLAREEAERQAELERQRQEEEAREIIRQEQEAIRLAEEQRRQEQARLQQAIEEAKKREEEEQKKREEEARLKAERDLEEKRKAEEAEKLRIETAERLKKEEKEREERRKRVEAIMARTRKGGANNTPNKVRLKQVLFVICTKKISNFFPIDC